MLERRVLRIATRLAACGLALVLFGACSSTESDDKAASSSATSAPATTAGGPTTTARPVDTSFTGQNSAQFCTLAKNYKNPAASLGSNPTPAQLKTVLTDGQTAINQALGAAPAEIKPDVQVIADAFTAFSKELAKVDYVAANVPPTALAPLSTPAFQTASARFAAYLKSVCGVG